MCGINEAVDDTILRIHLIPNIMELKDKIIKIYNVPKEDTPDDRFWILACINIKHALSEELAANVYMTLYNNISNIINSSYMTSYYIYRDAIEEKDRKIRESRSKDKNNQADSFEF